MYFLIIIAAIIILFILLLLYSCIAITTPYDEEIDDLQQELYISNKNNNLK